ncbi:unnamed protein product, partial [Oikopleura dioica]
ISSGFILQTGMPCARETSVFELFFIATEIFFVFLYTVGMISKFLHCGSGTSNGTSCTVSCSEPKKGLRTGTEIVEFALISLG